MRKFIYVIVLLNICLFAGCGQHNAVTETLNTSIEREMSKKQDLNEVDDGENISRGYDTEDELILAFINCLNADLNFEEFYQNFDAIGYCAYWVTEYTKDVCFDEAYEAFINSEKGSKYIEENYKEFCDHFLGPISLDELVFSLNQNSGMFINTLETNCSDFIVRLRENFGPYEPVIIDDNKWFSESGGCSIYTIHVDDPTGYIQSISIRYFIHDGKYYWILVNQTA